MTPPDTIARLTAEPAGEDVERVARALAARNAYRGRDRLAWSEAHWPRHVPDATAAIAALHSTDHIADAERVIVPREPTPEMIDRFVSRALCVSVHGDGGWSKYAREQWKAMLAAAPKPPTDDLRRTREAEAGHFDGVLSALDEALKQYSEPMSLLNGHELGERLAGDVAEVVRHARSRRTFLSTVSKEREHG